MQLAEDATHWFHTYETIRTISTIRSKYHRSGGYDRRIRDIGHASSALPPRRKAMPASLPKWGESGRGWLNTAVGATEGDEGGGFLARREPEPCLLRLTKCLAVAADLTLDATGGPAPTQRPIRHRIDASATAQGRAGDVLMWAKRATMHRGAGDYRPEKRRVVLGTTGYQK
jgi:hypothetical protein